MHVGDISKHLAIRGFTQLAMCILFMELILLKYSLESNNTESFGRIGPLTNNITDS